MVLTSAPVSAGLVIAVCRRVWGMTSLESSPARITQRRYAILAFIPLAGLVLLGKPSKKAMSINQIPTIQLLSGNLGIL